MVRAQDPATDPSTQGYAAFASTLTSMATASSILVQSPDERSAGRLLFIRKALATKLTGAIASGKPFTLADLDARPPTLASVMLPAARSTAPTDQFMLCYRAVWATMQDQISAALTTAANYDALADPGDTATLLTQFRQQAKNNFAQVKVPPADQSSLQYILAVVSFASDVATAISPANRTKIEQAITAMVKAY